VGVVSAGQVDYRLKRDSLIRRYRAGLIGTAEVCDAHPELLRAANSVGRPVSARCPICGQSGLTTVRYAFGSRLPQNGRCLESEAELDLLVRRCRQVVCYAVEVCRMCHWNHLIDRREVAASQPDYGEAGM
jgi:RNA polymerase subunit RPABC4/transcription elongation factor Spt4